MAGAKFDNVVGVIDGLLIWMEKPSSTDCDYIKCGETQFLCSRKSKYGMNLQAICDHRLCFTYFDLKWTGITSDYMAWVTSDLSIQLENECNVLKPKYTLIGDNAYVKRRYMSVPFKGKVQEYEDAYIFYFSQLRIIIERAFGVFVHRWGILHTPLRIPIRNVGPLVFCLSLLHNFCINNAEFKAPSTCNKDYRYMVSNNKDTPVSFNKDNIPVDILHGGEHFNDANHNREEYAPVGFIYPMDRIFEEVKGMNLVRPMIRTRHKGISNNNTNTNTQESIPVLS